MDPSFALIPLLHSQATEEKEKQLIFLQSPQAERRNGLWYDGRSMVNKGQLGVDKRDTISTIQGMDLSTSLTSSQYSETVEKKDRKPCLQPPIFLKFSHADRRNGLWYDGKSFVNK